MLPWFFLCHSKNHQFETEYATIIYPCEGFDPLQILKAVENERATAIYGVPTMFISLLEHPEFDTFNLKSLRTGIMAGSPCPIEILTKVRSLMHMRDVQIAYGMTETSPVSTQTRIGSSLDKQVTTVGQVHPHLEGFCAEMNALREVGK